jgi:tetratricopeptide (TPR) repeat protein
VEMGNLSEATKYYNQSLSMSREILFLRGQPYPLMGLGDILFAQGDLEGSRKRYEEALALGKQMNDTEVAAQVAVSLGQIELAEHKYSDGVAQARQAVAAYEKNNSIGNQAWAQAILARNLLAAGSLAEAQAATARSISLAKQTTAPAPGYESVLADSRVKAKSGKTADALKELEAPLASAKKIGYKLYEYQIALAIGEIESGSGSASARPRLTALEKDARAQGALLFAGQAQALLNQDSKAQTTKKK